MKNTTVFDLPGHYYKYCTRQLVCDCQQQRTQHPLQAEEHQQCLWCHHSSQAQHTLSEEITTL